MHLSLFYNSSAITLKTSHFFVLLVIAAYFKISLINEQLLFLFCREIILRSELSENWVVASHVAEHSSYNSYFHVFVICVKTTIHCSKRSIYFIITGEICAFKIHGPDTPFEAVVLNRTSGEGRLRAKGPIDCELQKEYTFIIQAYDCGASPSGANWKKSHK